MTIYEQYIQQNEDMVHGVRFYWNIFPSSCIEATRLVIPLVCLYHPIKEKPDHLCIEYDTELCTRTNCWTSLKS